MSDRLQRLERKRRKKEPLASRGKHWKTHRDKDDVLWVVLDQAESDVNTLHAVVLEELEAILEQLEEQLPQAVVFRSDKIAGFCAGADINELGELTKDQLSKLLDRGHAVMERIENIPVPTIAVIHGHCLGGGLELALACDLRVGVKGDLEVGFPEIKLGLHPGLGGTFRFTQLIDPLVAMRMMLTGKSAHAEQVLKRGIVDEYVELRNMNGAVLAALDGKVTRHNHNLKDAAMNSRAGRTLAAKKMRSTSHEKAPSKHYPAPYALIDLWEAHGGDRNGMLKAEKESFLKLSETRTAQNLKRVFHLRNTLHDIEETSSVIQHVHIIGAGTMGADIAGWCAMRGLHVTLSDQELQPLAKALPATHKLCESQHMSAAETRDVLDRLLPDLKGIGIKRADLVIEAVPEDLELKQKIFRNAEERMRRDAILATNTSSIPLERLRSSLKHQDRFLGLHFFNPVSKMKVVEVVRHDETSEASAQQALAVVRRLDKLPVQVNSYPGFLVNRALTPYLLEAIIMSEEGVPLEDIDRAAEEFGMPMGPIELIDHIGLDVCIEVASTLEDSLDKELVQVPHEIRAHVEQGNLGKKTGRGFYSWKDGEAQKETPNSTTEVYHSRIDRLILPIVNACAECYRKGVVENLEHIDAAIIFATGFAPFRGGPMHFARERGYKNVENELRDLSRKYGERFQPDPIWSEL